MGFKVLNEVDATDGTVQLVDGTSSTRNATMSNQDAVGLKDHSGSATSPSQEVKYRPGASAVERSERPSEMAPVEKDPGLRPDMLLHLSD